MQKVVPEDEVELEDSDFQPLCHKHQCLHLSISSSQMDHTDFDLSGVDIDLTHFEWYLLKKIHLTFSSSLQMRVLYPKLILLMLNQVKILSLVKILEEKERIQKLKFTCNLNRKNITIMNETIASPATQQQTVSMAVSQSVAPLPTSASSNSSIKDTPSIAATSEKGIPSNTIPNPDQRTTSLSAGCAPIFSPSFIIIMDGRSVM
ncbi:hypothetical protein FRX31_005381 [Thalictrum thalictroides]|uniref:Uncharacterized protein n=1 Tax=Thalictrum thalictroides TaxID=46969 RepID=A0A7J6X9E2_THATH|nr:hypothetical protein FRX31_005381 [Thalictrum thalictroides]